MSAKDLLTPWGVRVGGFPYWHTDEQLAWGAARQRAAIMRELLSVKGWWLAISVAGD